MKYVVIKHFTDLQDNGHSYHAGDTFPREGLTVSQKRIKELSSSGNRQNTPLIKEVAEKNPPAAKKEAVKPDTDDQENKPAPKKRKKVNDAE